MGIDVDGSGGGWCVAAVSLSIGDITVTLPAVPQLSAAASTATSSPTGLLHSTTLNTAKL